MMHGNLGFPPTRPHHHGALASRLVEVATHLRAVQNPRMAAGSGEASFAGVERLYRQLLDAWNRRSAADYAALFAGGGTVVGFDGSQMAGPAGIQAHLEPIFRDHPTALYVSIVREVRGLADGVALLRADAGMVPPGADDINPAVNAVQILIASRAPGADWRIEHFQNTPAAFHGRPELAQALSDELRQQLRSRG